MTDTGAAELYDGMNNARSTAFSHDGKLYILDGQSYLVATETGDTVGVTPVSEYAFTPTTVIGAPAAGGGTPFEAVNLLTGKRINSMVGDGEYGVPPRFKEHRFRGIRDGGRRGENRNYRLHG